MHKAFKSEKVKETLKRKALIKRLKRENKDIMRELKRAGVKRNHGKQQP